MAIGLKTVEEEELVNFNRKKKNKRKINIDLFWDLLWAAGMTAFLSAFYTFALNYDKLEGANFFQFFWSNVPGSSIAGALFAMLRKNWIMSQDYLYEKKESDEYHSDITRKLISSNYLTQLAVDESKSYKDNFTDFCTDNVFRNIRSDGGGFVIYNKTSIDDYRDLLSKAISCASSSINVVLVGKNLPDVVFSLWNKREDNSFERKQPEESEKIQKNLHYLDQINAIVDNSRIIAIRILIFKKAILDDSFSRMHCIDLLKLFLKYHSHTLLFWIDEDLLRNKLHLKYQHILSEFYKSDFGVVDDYLIVKKKSDETTNKYTNDCVEVLFAYHNELFTHIFSLLKDDLNNDHKNQKIPLLQKINNDGFNDLEGIIETFDLKNKIKTGLISNFDQNLRFIQEEDRLIGLSALHKDNIDFCLNQVFRCLIQNQKSLVERYNLQI